MHAEPAIAPIVGAIMALGAIAVATRAVTKRTSFPFSVALVLVGIALAELLPRGPSFLHEITELELNAELILIVFLPTLVYASATELDARQLRRNLVHVLGLAIPGLLLSTALIGLVLSTVTSMSLAVALLVGAILSATDPVAVVSLFQRLGAPTRLTVLVEGESLFNDATAIVVSRLLLGIVLSGVVDASAIGQGLLDFVRVFVGGLIAGFVLAGVVGWLVGKVDDDAYIEVPLTIVLAYAAFLVAEEAFHVSGVMAVVAAGTTMGTWGRTKVSPGVHHLLETTWAQLAFAANALVFLLVGLRVDLGAIAASWDVLAWVIVAMLAARAAVLFGLVPALTSIRGVAPVSRPYRLVMWWGGLRGAIALALVLSLPEGLAGDLDLIAIVTGVVLVTLVVRGLTMQPLVHHLGLDQPTVRDRVLQAEVNREGLRRAREHLDVLRAEPMFPTGVGTRMQADLDAAEAEADAALHAVRAAEVDADTQRRLVWLRLLSVERATLHRLFAEHHLTEASARALQHRLDVQVDEMRHTGQLIADAPRSAGRQRLERQGLRLLDRVLGRTALPARLHYGRTARAYERTWASFHLASAALDELAHVDETEDAPTAVIEEARQVYESWRAASQARLDTMAAEFPEFVEAAQDRLATRMLLGTRHAVIDEHHRSGVLPSGLTATMHEALDRSAPRPGIPSTGLQVDLDALLRAVPVFADLSDDACHALAQRLHQQTVPPGTVIIRQGEPGTSLFLIARGVVRAVVRLPDGEEVETTTMMAGDFFGEVALLHGGRRTATCRAVTPCAVYEVRRRTVLALADEDPAIRAELEAADRARNEALGGGASALL